MMPHVHSIVLYRKVIARFVYAFLYPGTDCHSVFANVLVCADPGRSTLRIVRMKKKRVCADFVAVILLRHVRL